ncbi:hypothetical protein SG34_029190 [Thalassomonas viridans]|uniref:Uncharacterized protein n=1 Tax=Thalassomonas viridans TaxID=137584 RepID=A0AAE9Z3C7_9GAMM|nr:hypothetical protein [Thalassomonas viridans]WDE05315.1 hypothetical protein SG34_029190 [Thalassomonas viridans]
MVNSNPGMVVICNRIFYLSRSLLYCLLLVTLSGCQSNGSSASGAIANDPDNFAYVKRTLEENARRQEQMLEQLGQLLAAHEAMALNVKAIKIQVEAQQTQLLALSKNLASLTKVMAPYSVPDGKAPGQRQILEQLLLAMDALKTSLGQLETEQEALYQKLYGKPSKLFYLCRPPRCEQDYESDIDFSR